MKRFTETQKWNDPWFRRLRPAEKLLWLWMLDNCDCAGIIEPDMDLAKFQLGASEDLPSPSEAFGDRVEQQGGKFLIVKFIPYQYGPVLKECNNAHKGVIKRIEASEFKGLSHLIDGEKNKNEQGASEGLVRGYQAHQEQEQEQEQDKDKDKDKEQKQEKKKFKKPTLQELSSYSDKIHAGINPQSFLDFYESKGWKVGSTPMADWKAAVRTWKTRSAKTNQPRPTNEPLKYQQNGYKPRPFD